MLFKLNILCHRKKFEQRDYFKAFLSYELAYKEMESDFKEALDYYGVEDDGEETTIEDCCAKITTEEMWEDWAITECELEISSFEEFTSVFKEFLGNYSSELGQFVTKVPASIT